MAAVRVKPGTSLRLSSRIAHADQLPRLAALVWREEVPPGDDEALATAAIRNRLEGYADLAVAENRWRPPPAVARLVADARARGSLRTALLRRELTSVARVVAGACGSPPVVLKGPALAARVHRDRTLRPYGDLDLLVPRERLRDAAAALVADGWAYRVAGHFVGAIGEPFEGWTEAYGHELALERRTGSVVAGVELHWRVSDDVSANRLDHARVAARAVPWPELGDGVLVPDAADELILLALHVLHHRSLRLMWAADVALARDALDDRAWERAFAAAAELGLSWALHAGLDLAEDLLGRPRERPEAPPRRAPFGALRAVQLLPGRVGEHTGRLAGLGWRDRGRYAAAVIGATWRRRT